MRHRHAGLSESCQVTLGQSHVLAQPPSFSLMNPVPPCDPNKMQYAYCPVDGDSRLVWFVFLSATERSWSLVGTFFCRMMDLLSCWNHSSLSSLPSPASPGCPKFSGAVSSSSLASWLRPSLLGFPEEELCPSRSHLSRYLPGTGHTGGTARWTEAPDLGGVEMSQMCSLCPPSPGAAALRPG